MFVPVGQPILREVSLYFEGGDCYVLVNGVRILKLSEDSVILNKYVNEETTGLKVGLDTKVIIK